MNKKILLPTIVILVLVAALGVVGIAAAQTPTPPNGYGYGNGMMGGYGGMMGGYGGGMMGGYGNGMMGGKGMMQGGYGPMHDAMFNTLAGELGLTRAELDERVANGETPYQIALSLGFSQTEFAQLMADARTAALTDAVADGTLTQEQADWMQNRMNKFGGNCPHFAQDADDN